MRENDGDSEQIIGREFGAATFLKTSLVKSKVARIRPEPRQLNRSAFRVAIDVSRRQDLIL